VESPPLGVKSSDQHLGTRIYMADRHTAGNLAQENPHEFQQESDGRYVAEYIDVLQPVLFLVVAVVVAHILIDHGVDHRYIAVCAGDCEKSRHGWWGATVWAVRCASAAG
jgi:hypothetical protein